MMSRFAFAVIFLSASALAGPMPLVSTSGVDKDITILIPGIPEFTYEGITFSSDKNITIVFSVPTFLYGTETVHKYATVDNKAFSIVFEEYKMSGKFAGFNLNGKGSIQFSLSDHILEQLSYTSTSKDSFCAKPDSVKFFMKTNKGHLNITGMESKDTQDLLEDIVNNDPAHLGHLVAEVINAKFGKIINKFAVPMINSICHML